MERADGESACREANVIETGLEHVGARVPWTLLSLVEMEESGVDGPMCGRVDVDKRQTCAKDGSSCSVMLRSDQVTKP